MNEEMLQKAKAAASPEELLKMAHESGMEDFTEENAKAYYETMHRSGELSDDELENAAGGCKDKYGRRVVTLGLRCPGSDACWQCKVCHKDEFNCTCGRGYTNIIEDAFEMTGNFKNKLVCGSCGYCSYEGGKWLCNNPDANAK